MNVFEVYDLRDGDRKDVEATSPVAALKRLGYTDIVRNKAGNIVVYGRRESCFFAYNARKKN